LGYQIFRIEWKKFAGLKIDNVVSYAEKFVVPIEVVGSDENGITGFEKSNSRANFFGG